MTLLLAILSLAQAADRVILVLPPSEVAASWESAAVLAGLTIAPPKAGPRIELLDQGMQWRLVARDADGNEKAMTLPPPRTAAQREDAVWLAVSLLAATPHPPDLSGGPVPISTPVPLPVLAVPVERVASPPLPRSKPRPRRVAPPEVRVFPAPAAPAATVASPLVIPPAPLCPPMPAPDPKPLVEAPPRPPLAVHAWATLGPAMAWRAQTVSAAGLDLAAGLALGRSTWVGVGLSWLAPRDLVTAESDARLRTTDGRVEIRWSPQAGRIAPLVGVSVGESTRTYTQESTAVARFWVAALEADAGLAWSFSPHLAATATASGAWDLNQTRLEHPDGSAELQSPLQLGGGVGMRFRL